MTVPQGRNQKKTKHRKRTVYPAMRRKRLLDDNSIERNPDFEDWLDEMHNPGDWLEQVPYMPTFEDRLLASRPMSFLDRPRSFLDRDDDYDSDIGNDFDDFYDFEDFE